MSKIKALGGLTLIQEWWVQLILLIIFCTTLFVILSKIFPKITISISSWELKVSDGCLSISKKEKSDKKDEKSKNAEEEMDDELNEEEDEEKKDLDKG